MIGGKRSNWYSDTLQGRAYIGGTEKTGVAANLSHIQLWNPNASGKLLVVDRVWLRPSQNGIVYFSRHATALANAGLQGNKYLGGAAGVGLVKHEHTGAAVGTQISQYFVEKDFLFQEPIIIGQNNGLVVTSTIANATLQVAFEWIEVPV